LRKSLFFFLGLFVTSSPFTQTSASVQLQSSGGLCTSDTVSQHAAGLSGPRAPPTGLSACACCARTPGRFREDGRPLAGFAATPAGRRRPGGVSGALTCPAPRPPGSARDPTETAGPRGGGAWTGRVDDGGRQPAAPRHGGGARGAGRCGAAQRGAPCGSGRSLTSPWGAPARAPRSPGAGVLGYRRDASVRNLGRQPASRSHAPSAVGVGCAATARRDPLGAVQLLWQAPGQGHPPSHDCCLQPVAPRPRSSPPALALRCRSRLLPMPMPPASRVHDIALQRLSDSGTRPLAASTPLSQSCPLAHLRS
jgi:hypothetical protein